MSTSLVVARSAYRPGADGQTIYGMANRLGQQVVCDFYTHAALMGKGFNLRHGTISTPEVGDVLITDAKAEAAVAAASGTTIIPVHTNINFNLAAATLFETAGKSVNASTMSGGTAFVPLPLRTKAVDGGTAAAAVATAMVGSAGGVTVAAELATTTARHFSWGHPIAAGAWPTTYDWRPLAPPVLVGAASYYVQIGGDTTGPSYFLSIEFLEWSSSDLI